MDKDEIFDETILEGIGAGRKLTPEMLEKQKQFLEDLKRQMGEQPTGELTDTELEDVIAGRTR